jgi:hypothetical protein
MQHNDFSIIYNCPVCKYGYDWADLPDNLLCRFCGIPLSSIELKCAACGRKDGEGPDGGRRVSYVPEWNDTLCLSCAASFALVLLRMENKDELR